jgi:hypothetical protein
VTLSDSEYVIFAAFADPTSVLIEGEGLDTRKMLPVIPADDVVNDWLGCSSSVVSSTFSLLSGSIDMLAQ